MLATRREDGKFVGYIELRSGVYCFSIYPKRDCGPTFTPDLDSLCVEPELISVLDKVKHSDKFKRTLSKQASFADFATALQAVLRESSFEIAKKSQLHSTYILTLLKHLDDLGWQNVTYLSPELTTVNLRVLDIDGREHIYEVCIADDYPISCPSVTVALPSKVPIYWDTAMLNSDLRYIQDIVYKEINRYKHYISVLADLDNHVWVMEPAKPSFAIASRRIVLERACSLLVDIDPENPLENCNIKFLGPDSIASKFKQLLDRNNHRWSSKRMVRENLEDILEVTFPSKTEEGNDSIQLECGICYSYKIASTSNISESVQIPDEMCANNRCQRVYHSSCLLEWFRALPSTRTSFGNVFGSCPYCQEHMVIKCK